ncbi:MAG: hypothetical protein E4H01_14485, partial [Lysobacterales bacterium]
MYTETRRRTWRHNVIRQFSAATGVAIVLSLPVVAMAQTVDQVFDGMIAAENAGYRGVDDYVLKTNTMGVSTLEYYEKTSSLTLDNGQTVYVMRKVPTREIGQRQSSN